MRRALVPMPLLLAFFGALTLAACGGSEPRPEAPRHEADEIPVRWSEEDEAAEASSGGDAPAGDETATE